MLDHRVIPVLLLADGGVVKTERFSKPVYIGDPINTIRLFNDMEVDEIVVLDITKSRVRAEPDFALISEMASECFMPLAYGGGITRLEQAERILASGVEKVVLQTATLGGNQLVRELASVAGSQSVVVSVDVKKDWRGRHRLYSAALRKCLASDWLTHVCDVVAAGAGEVLLTVVDRDGTMSGFDLDVIRAASRVTPVPLVANGGARDLADFRAAIEAGADAVAAGAMFVFSGPRRGILVNYPRRNELKAALAEIEAPQPAVRH